MKLTGRTVIVLKSGHEKPGRVVGEALRGPIVEADGPPELVPWHHVARVQ